MTAAATLAGSLAGQGMTSQRARDRLVAELSQAGITDQRVLGVMRELPRHAFVDEALATHAYTNKALPIGDGQTISQPYIVALMTQSLLADGPCGRVLEIGTGSGYQTAVLSALVDEVYTIERIEKLYARARKVLRTLKARNVHFTLRDGNEGWPLQAPFDGILLTAAPQSVPEALFSQLADGGRLIAPVGGSGGQRLLRYTRQGDRVESVEVEAVSFVPMLGGVQRSD